MIIYKVRYFINKRKRNNELEQIGSGQEIIIDNLDYAKEVFEEYKNKCECSQFYCGYHGRAELFIPHVHENGLLAYWPNEDQYIEQFKF